MKKANISIPIEDERLQALRLFAGKKDADIETELRDALDKLYEKYVPKDARELVEMMAGKAEPARPRAPKKDGAGKPAAEKPNAGKGAPQPAGAGPGIGGDKNGA